MVRGGRTEDGGRGRIRVLVPSLDRRRTRALARHILRAWDPVVHDPCLATQT